MKGTGMTNLPMMGDVRTASAVYAGLEKYGCGYDMIILAAAFIALQNNLSNIIAKIPKHYRFGNGDYESLVNIMKALLNERLHHKSNEFKVSSVCKQLKIDSKS